jgi:hypothetical protein
MPLPVHTTEKPSTSETTETTAATEVTNPPAQGDGAASVAGAQTKSDAEIAAEKLYEERMEEEYAKREGGA